MRHGVMTWERPMLARTKPSITDRAIAGDTNAAWRHRIMIAVVSAAVALFAAPAFSGSPDVAPSARFPQSRLPSHCARWDEVAGRAVTQLVVASGDIDLRRLTGGIDRIHHAR